MVSRPKTTGRCFPLPKFGQFNKESLDSGMRENGEQTKPKPLPSPDIPTAQLGPSLVIDGEVNTDQNLFVAGIVRGRLRSQAKLTISESAIVEVPVHGAIVIIKGRVQGTIQAQDRIQLVEGAIVHGDLIAPKVDIRDGATFQGKLLLVNDQTQRIEG